MKEYPIDHKVLAAPIAHALLIGRPTYHQCVGPKRYMDLSPFLSQFMKLRFFLSNFILGTSMPIHKNWLRNQSRPTVFRNLFNTSL